MKTRLILLAALGFWIVGPAGRADDWPQFRGPNRDNVSKETGLLKAWPKDGPKLLWTATSKSGKKDAGYGLSDVAIVGDTLYTMGARGEDEYVLAFDVNSGKEKWAAQVGKIFTFQSNTWGDGPRSTPTVDVDSVYALGGQGELVCVKRDSGTLVWKKSFANDFHGQVMEFAEGTNWGFCESPLIDGDKLICCPGGPDGWMVALDKKTGNLLWRTKEITDQAADSSAVVAVIGGVRQYVNCSYKGENGGGVAGVDPNTGKILWYGLNKTFHVYALCSTPIVKDNLVYICAGESKGCSLFEVTKDDKGKFTAKDIYASNRKAQGLMVNQHGGVLLTNGCIFGHSEGKGWLCQDFKSGNLKWSEKFRLEGKGSLTCADGCLYLLSDQGEVALIEASTEEWKELGRFKLPELSPSRQTRPTHVSVQVWTHPVVANGRLYLRDQEFLYCYDVRSPK
jgi:outer membrane protein assembly factor BamB